MGHVYENQFYDYINQGSLRSANIVVPIVNNLLKPASILDIGCGQGAWLKVWSDNGINDVVGVDGEYVDRKRLLIPAEKFISSNLADEVNLSRQFDLVQSLEVAEHLPSNRAERFISNLCNHGDVVLFSAAQQGQGGENHINERPLEYWRDLFSDHGFLAVDNIRPIISDNKQVEPWYRYNTVLYIRNSSQLLDNSEIADAILPDKQNFRNVMSIPWKIRLALTSILPGWVSTQVARLNARYQITIRKYR